MLHREALVASTGALAASAFLVPAGVSSPLVLGDLSVSLYDPTSQIVRLPCSACVFPYKDADAEIEESATIEDTFWIQGGANDVIVNLSVSPGQVLEMNGRPIWPFEDLLDAHETMRVVQSPASASDAEIGMGIARSASLEVTGSRIAMESRATMDTGDVLTTVRLSIAEIEMQELGLDDILVSLLNTIEGDLLILGTRAVPSFSANPHHFTPEGVDVPAASPPPFRPSRPSSGPHDAHPPQCGHLPPALCHLVTTVEAKMAQVKSLVTGKKPGCHGRPRPEIGHVPGHIKPPFLRGGAPLDGEDDQGKRPPHPPSGRHHRHHFHGHHHRHSFFRSVVHGFFAVVVPTLAGVVVGMSISVVGLLLARLLGYLWQRLTRAEHSDYEPVALEEARSPVNDLEKVKEDFEVNQELFEAPPKYEDAPSYVQDKGGQ